MRPARSAVPELVDPATVSPSAPWRAMKQAGLVLLCVAWVGLGLLGREPWKTEDAITFAVAWEMVQRHDWLVPQVAHELAFSEPPLVPWLAAGSLTLLHPPLAAPDAGRMAVGLLLALLLVFTGLAGRELNGRAMRWVPVLVVVGSVGLFDRGHHLSGELGLAVAVIAAVYGVALALRRPASGGVVLGLAFAAAFLAGGWLGPLWTLIPALLLPVIDATWRSRCYAAALALAVAIALPLSAAWPLALHARSPALFEAWSQAEPLASFFAVGGGSGTASPLWVARNLVWFAWPAVALIGWALWIRGRGFNGGLRPPGVVVPAAFAGTILLLLLVLPEPRLMQMIPLLAPMALLGSLEVDSLKRGQSAALDWFGILTFGLAAMALWGFWIDAYFNGLPARVAILLNDTETGYGLAFNLRAMLAALFLTAAWILLVRPARRSSRRAVLNWAMGMTLVWGLVSTLWLPYVDVRRTYQGVGESLGVHRPADGCIAQRDVSLAQRALFYYFAGVVTVPESSPQAARCSMLLVQYGRVPDGVPQLPGHAIAWEGTRRGDRSERFVLYRKNPT
jgi:4-amino-4-deoxy-L-arabinose transferase-like glycosyltransferase